MAIRLSGLDYGFEWGLEPLAWGLDEEGLSLTAGPASDLFTSPQGAAPVANAPSLTFVPTGDFIFSAKVTVGFRSTFDAGVLLVYQTPTSWAKLCFEFAPQGHPLVVSVVTKGLSDDCNSLFVDENATYLRVSRLGSAFAFHHSFDAIDWHLVRLFALEPNVDTRVGFLAQSPTGAGCTALFSKLAFRAATLNDVRSGE